MRSIFLGLVVACLQVTAALAQLPPGGALVPSMPWSAIPSPSPAGKLVRASNYGATGSLLMSTGTRWKPASGCATLAALEAASSNVPNSETIVFQYLIPANVLQNKDRLRLWLTTTKSGTTDTGSLRLRMGTAGTTADTQLYSAAIISAANRGTSLIIDLRLETATSIQQVGNNAGTGAQAGYSTTSGIAFAAPVTITSAAANALYFSVSILSGSTNDTVAMQDAQLQLCATPN